VRKTSRSTVADRVAEPNRSDGTAAAAFRRLRARAPRASFRRSRSAGETSEPSRRPWLGRLSVGLIRATAKLPLGVAQGLGALAGLGLAILPTRARRVSAVNLRIAFPEMSARDRRRLLRRSLMHLGRSTYETGPMWLWSAERIESLVRETEGEQLVRDALASGDGVVVAVPHLGSWEFLSNVLSIRYRGTYIYRHPRMPDVDALCTAARCRFGATMVAAGSQAMHAIVRALHRGELVGLMPDQDPGIGSGIFVPYFGKAANTAIFVPRLVSARKPRVVVGHAERLPRGRGFRIRFEPGDRALYDADLEVSASALNRQFERMIRRCPEQYLWAYKRWRIRPPGDALGDPYRAP
jgi:KDO2-lipid IV(A) lauroyltransferase